MSNNSLSFVEMKEIANEIFLEEEKRTGIKLKVYPLTFIEYYNEFIFKGKFSLTKKSSYALMPILSLGFNDFNNNLVIFLERIKKCEKVDGSPFLLAKVCYHEFRHSEQKTFNPNNYERFVNDLEMLIKKCGFYGLFDYYLEHDKYSFEIGANLYGLEKAKEFLKRTRPEIYEQEKENIEKRENKVYIDYYTYDAADVFNRFIEKYRSLRQMINRGELSINEKKYDPQSINPVLKIFIEENGGFKKIADIINNEEFKKIDKRIIAAVFSSKSFLEDIKIEELTVDELALLYKYLEYTNTIYNNQSVMLKKLTDNKKMEKEDLITIESFLKKLAKYQAETINLFFSEIHMKRNENDRLRHIDTVSEYMEAIDTEIKRK